MRPAIQRCLVAFLWLSVAAHAGGNCYVSRPIVIDGKTKPIEPVCRALAKNLNRFCDQQPPMVCGLKIHPDFRRQFSLPEWKPAPPDRERIEAFMRAPLRATQFGRREAAPMIEAALAENRLHFAEANVDIYNLGKKQPAYRLDLGDCEAIGKSRGPGDPLDFNQNWIHHSPEVVKDLFSRYVPIGVSHLNGYLFTFRGKTYNAGMSGYVNPLTGDAENVLWVNRYERARLSSVGRTNLIKHNTCEFEYHFYQES